MTALLFTSLSSLCTKQSFNHTRDNNDVYFVYHREREAPLSLLFTLRSRGIIATGSTLHQIVLHILGRLLIPRPSQLSLQIVSLLKRPRYLFNLGIRNEPFIGHMVRHRQRIVLLGQESGRSLWCCLSSFTQRTLLLILLQQAVLILTQLSRGFSNDRAVGILFDWFLERPSLFRQLVRSCKVHRELRIMLEPQIQYFTRHKRNRVVLDQKVQMLRSIVRCFVLLNRKSMC